MLSRLILITFICAGYFPGVAQERFTSDEDSLAFEKGDKAFALANKNSDSAILLGNQALHQATTLKSNRSMGNAWNAIGWTLMHKGFLDSSTACLQKAWQLFSKTGHDNDVIRVCINISEVYTKQGNISTALKYLMQADSLCIKTGNTAFQTNVWRQFGIVYRESKDYKKSAEYFTRAMSGFTKLKDYFRLVSTGISVSILYRKLKMMDSSLAILNRILITAREKTKLPYQVAMVEEHIAETYYSTQKYTDALAHYTIAYKTFEQLNNKADLAFESFGMGKTLMQLNRVAEAEKYLLQSYALNDTLKMLNYQWDASIELADLYKKTGNWQKGFYYLEKAAALKDSLDVAEQINQTNALKEKFETEKKENEITLLKTQNQLTAVASRRTRLLQYIFIILFVAAVIIGWLLLNRFKIKRKLDEQILRNQIAGDLHDDIGSALSIIDISSRVALAKQDDKLAMTEQLVKIQQYAGKTMDSMGDIVWSVNPNNDNLESVLGRVREFAAEVCEPMNIDLQFKVAGEFEHLLLDADKRKNIFLICKEAINNAVKYSGCQSLSIEVEKTGIEGLLIKIMDDGKGFNTDTPKKGNGLLNMQARAGHLKATLTIQSVANKGTSILLHCPLS